jgi:hypothetical protein
MVFIIRTPNQAINVGTSRQQDDSIHEFGYDSSNRPGHWFVLGDFVRQLESCRSQLWHFHLADWRRY